MAIFTGPWIRPRLRVWLLVLPLALGLGSVATTSPPAVAAVAAGGDPIYMKFTGPDVAGESKAKGHENEIDVLSYSFGVTSSSVSSAGGGGGAGKVKFNEFTITKTVDRASPVFFQACAAGTHFSKVTISARKSGGDPFDYFQITLSDALITGYSISSGGDRPTESISMSFGKINMSYIPQRDDGSPDVPVKAGWDVKANVKA